MDKIKIMMSLDRRFSPGSGTGTETITIKHYISHLKRFHTKRNKLCI